MGKLILTRQTLAEFRQTLEDESRAGATVEKYLRESRAFARWLAGAPVTREALLAWRERLEASALAPATVNGKLAAVNRLLRHLGREEWRVRLLKVQRRTFREPGRELTRAEYLRLVETAREEGRERLALLMETLCAAGLRVSELRFLTVEAAQRGRAVIRLKGKVRTVLLPGKLRRKLLRYAAERKTVSGEIFLTKDGRSLNRKGIWREMKALCARAGVAPGKVFPHNLRHLFAVTFYRVCRDIVKLADVLGHSSVETTRIYLATTGAEHERCLEKLRLIC